MALLKLRQTCYAITSRNLLDTAPAAVGLQGGRGEFHSKQKATFSFFQIKPHCLFKNKKKKSKAHKKPTQNKTKKKKKKKHEKKNHKGPEKNI